MRTSLIPLAVLAIVGPSLPANAHPVAAGWGYAPAPYATQPAGWDRDDRHDRDDRDRDWRRGDRGYGYGRPDPRYNGYYADNYYRGGGYGRRLDVNDRIYRGRDNRYYCRRSDGTTGLIIGALGGGVLGNVIAPGGSKTLGSILGGGLGAVLGNSIDRGNVVCR